MSEADNIPADWVLLEAARRTSWMAYDPRIERLRQEYHIMGSTFRALCDMIAKYEQPPVDPDVEAVKRICAAHMGEEVSSFTWRPEALARAVAQYKQERGNV